MWDTHIIHHTRTDYTVIDLLGDIGGIQYMFVSMVGFLFLSFSEFNLFLDAFNNLFHLKDRDNALLFNQQNKNQKIDLSGYKFKKEKNKPISFSYYQSI